MSKYHFDDDFEGDLSTSENGKNLRKMKKVRTNEDWSWKNNYTYSRANKLQKVNKFLDSK